MNCLIYSWICITLANTACSAAMSTKIELNTRLGAIAGTTLDVNGVSVYRFLGECIRDLFTSQLCTVNISCYVSVLYLGDPR